MVEGLSYNSASAMHQSAYPMRIAGASLPTQERRAAALWPTADLSRAAITSVALSEFPASTPRNLRPSTRHCVPS